MAWKSKTWKLASNPDKSQHRSLKYEDNRSAEFLMGNMKRYRMQLSKDTVVHLYSKDFADHLAWIPQVSYYQELLNNKVSVSSEYADLLSPSYPNINWIDAAGYHHSTGFNIPNAEKSAQIIIIGSDFNTQGLAFKQDNSPKSGGYNLQFGPDGKVKTGSLDNVKDRYMSSIATARTKKIKSKQLEAAVKLGFKGFKEIKPKLEVPLLDKPTENPYVTISTEGYEDWGRGNWQEIVDFLLSKHYVVVTIDNESSRVSSTLNYSGYFSVESKASHIKQAEFHIGVKNDWAWLAWSLRKPTLTVSGEVPEFENNALHIIEEEGIDFVDPQDVESAIDILEKEKRNGRFTN